MHRKASLAATFCALALLATAAAAADSRTLTTAEAYQSWTAWYRLDGSRPADPNGPRYRQLLAAADGGQFFVEGLTNPSPQVRELSKQALLKLPTDGSILSLLTDLYLHTRDHQVEQAIAEIFPHPRMDDMVASGAANDADSDTDAALLRSASDRWQIPFGGLVRLALGGGTGVESRPEEVQTWIGCYYLDDLRMHFMDLQSELWSQQYRPIIGLEGNMYPGVCHFGTGVVEALTRAEALQSSRDAAQKLLTWLDQSAAKSLAELTGTTTEIMRRSLREHAPRALPATLDATAPADASQPLYRVHMELEQPDLPPPQITATSVSRIRADGRVIVLSAPRPLEAALERLSQPLPLLWSPAYFDTPQALPPGIYKLLLTFELVAKPSLEFASLARRETRVAGVVFRVKAASANAAATSNLLDSQSTDGDSEWEIVRVAVSGSGLPDDDLCAPSPSLIPRSCGEYRYTPLLRVASSHNPDEGDIDVSAFDIGGGFRR